MSRNRRKTRHNRAAIRPPLAAMGDIAFLLIIFFILASSFAKEPPAKLDLALSQKLDVLGSAKALVVIDKDNAIYFNSHEVDGVETIENSVMEIYKDVEEAELRIVHFKCHRDATKKIFEPVIDAIAKAGAMIAVVGEEGDPSKPKE